MRPRYNQTLDVGELAEQLNVEERIVRRVLIAAQQNRSVKAHDYGMNYTDGEIIG